jgi:hypothetical protein
MGYMMHYAACVQEYKCSSTEALEIIHRWTISTLEHTLTLQGRAATTKHPRPNLDNAEYQV